MNKLSPPVEIDQDHNVLKDSISNKLYFVSLYSVTVGVLYLWGYWTSFGVNILEFLDLSDIIKVTAYPIAAFALTAGLGVAFGNLISPSPTQTGDSNIQAAGNDLIDSTTPRHFVEQHVWPIFNFIERHHKEAKIFYLATLFFLFLSDWDERWVIIPFLLAAPISLILVKHRVLHTAFPNVRLRIILISLLPLICFGSYGMGRVQSAHVINGHMYWYVTSEMKGYPYKSATSALRYVGHAGDRLFLYEPTDKIMLIAKFEDDTPLALKAFREEPKLKNYWEEKKEMFMRIVHIAS